MDGEITLTGRQQQRVEEEERILRFRARGACRSYPEELDYSTGLGPWSSHPLWQLVLMCWVGGLLEVNQNKEKTRMKKVK